MQDPSQKVSAKDIEELLADSGAGTTTAAPVATATAPTQATSSDALVQQILASSDPTRWTGEGFGSAQANAADMAKVLARSGITDVSQLGTRTLTNQSTTDYDGNTTATPDVVQFYNKNTGQAIDAGYDRAGGNIFSGTFTGKGNTGYGVQFDAQGNPHFYTQGGSSSDIGDVAGILSVLQWVPGLQVPVALANAALSAYQGNPLGALASVAGVPGVSDVVGSGVTSALQTANQAKTFANAIDKGDILGAVSSGANLTGTGGTQLGDTGYSVSDAVQAAKIAKAVESGNPAALLSALTAKTSTNAMNADAPLDAKALSELDPEERAAYDAGGMKGLRDYATQQKAAGTATADDDAFWQSIGINPDTTGQWTSPSNVEIANLIEGGGDGSTPDNLVVTGALDTGTAEPGFENWTDPSNVLVTGNKLINAGDENVFNPDAVDLTDLGVVDVTGDRPTGITYTPKVDTFTPSTDLNTILTNPPVTPPGTPKTPTTNTSTSTTPKTTTTTPKTTTTSQLVSTPESGRVTSEMPLSDVELMDEIFGTHLFTHAPKAASSKTAKAATGGSIDDLLKLLRS